MSSKNIIYKDDKEYPELLRQIGRTAPKQLYYKGNWHFVVGTISSSIARIYIDGVFETSSIDIGSMGTGEYPVKIGVEATGANYFSGSIDDVRIYNRALGAEEVKRLYNLGR